MNQGNGETTYTFAPTPAPKGPLLLFPLGLLLLLPFLFPFFFTSSAPSQTSRWQSGENASWGGCLLGGDIIHPPRPPEPWLQSTALRVTEHHPNTGRWLREAPPSPCPLPGVLSSDPGGKGLGQKEDPTSSCPSSEMPERGPAGREQAQNLALGSRAWGAPSLGSLLLRCRQRFQLPNRDLGEKNGKGGA